MRPRPLAVLALASMLGAQGRTFVVDASNGPGTHFTDLPQALAQGRDGDTFRIRAGSYSPCALSLGITLLGEAGAAIVAAAWSTAALKVSDLGAGKTLVVRNLQLTPSLLGEAAVVQGAAGRVHFDGCWLGSAFVEGSPTLLKACREVTFTACTVFGGIRCTDSTVSIVTTSILPFHAFVPATPISALRSHLWIANSTLQGSPALLGPGAFLWATAGILADSSTVVVSATAASMTSVSAGATTSSTPGLGVSAIHATGGSVVVDAKVSLRSSGSYPLAPPLVVGVTFAAVPVLAARVLPEVGGSAHGPSMCAG